MKLRPSRNEFERIQQESQDTLQRYEVFIHGNPKVAAPVEKPPYHPRQVGEGQRDGETDGDADGGTEGQRDGGTEGQRDRRQRDGGRRDGGTEGWRDGETERRRDGGMEQRREGQSS
jgi:hypothetical protein